MAEQPNISAGAGMQVRVLGQYVKDLSFESPNITKLLTNPPGNPNLNLELNVEPTRINGDLYESALLFKAQAQGSTGVIYDLEVVYAGLFEIKRDRGIYRPALAIPVPVPGNPVTLVDVGANAEVRPEHLVQFAFMGAAFARSVMQIERPRVALLSNGEEPTKGTPLVVETHALLRERLGDRAGIMDFVAPGGDAQAAADQVQRPGLVDDVGIEHEREADPAYRRSLAPAAVTPGRDADEAEQQRTEDVGGARQRQAQRLQQFQLFLHGLGCGGRLAVRAGRGAARSLSVSATAT